MTGGLRRVRREAGLSLWLVVWLAIGLALPGVALSQAQVETGPAEAVVTAEGPVLEVAGPDYAAWALTAERTEALSERGRGSAFALERLRADLVIWREEFLQAQGLNATRIATVEGQIAALGPVPESGTEAPEITARRDALQEQLARLRVPVRLAQEGHAHANGLIAEVDALIRSSRTSALLDRGLSPLNPGIWPEAAVVLNDRAMGLLRELGANLTSPARWSQFYGIAVQTGLWLLLGAILLVRGRGWSVRLRTLLTQRMAGPAAEGVWRFLTSLVQIALAFAGLLMLQRGLEISGFLGLAGQRITDALPQAGLFVIIARWLGDQLAAAETENHPFLDLRRVRRGKVSAYVLRAGWVLALGTMVEAFLATGEASPAATALALLPVQLWLTYVLFRLGQILMIAAVPEAGSADEDARFRRRIFGLLGRLLKVIAAIGPVLAFAGYSNATDALIVPSVMTLVLVAVGLLLQGFVTDAYALLAPVQEGGQEGGRDALIPVLFGFAITMLAIPVLALIWGAGVQDLAEVWARFSDGYTFGETRLSPTDFLTFGFVFVLGYMLTRLLQSTLRGSVLPKTRIDKGGQNAIVAGVGYIGIFAAALVAISSAGLDLSSLAIVAGALSVGIGFGLQNIVSNFVSGIILLIERPISEGDWIEVGGQMGYVRAISVRSTRIETFDRTDVIIPNADLVSGMVTNWTRGNSVGRAIVPVGVAYGSDVEKVTEILTEIATSHPMVMLTPPPAVLLIGFGANSIDFEIRAILRDVNFLMSVKSEMNHAINRRFAAEGIEMPFAQRDLWLRNPEVLHPKGET
jgi:potassium-dependent mechanosensitive channel